MDLYRFYIRMDDEVFGPYSLQEFHELEVPNDVEVMEVSVKEWCLASELPSYEELNARENGYWLMPDGSVEKVHDDVESSDK